MTSHHDVAGLLLRLRGRAHDAPMDHEHMMDEAIEALESAEASNTILWQINGQSSAQIKTLVGQKTEWMDRALAAEARLAESEAERDALRHDIDRHIKIASENEAFRVEAEAALSGHVVGWRTMDSAPKDGTWFLAYRPSTSFGVYSTLVAVCWDQESNDFVWPTDIFDVYNPPDLSAHDERGFLEVDVYESQGSFTHWQNLPAPPVQEMEG